MSDQFSYDLSLLRSQFVTGDLIFSRRDQDGMSAPQLAAMDWFCRAPNAYDDSGLEEFMIRALRLEDRKLDVQNSTDAVQGMTINNLLTSVGKTI